MQYIILDLEWNGMPLYVTGGYFNEIIEIGAVKLDSSLKTVDTFQALVRPKVHKKLTGRVKRLTHITNDAVRAADNFKTTYAAFRKWLGDEENCFLSWGTGDILVILENLKMFGMPENLDIMDYYCDAQVLCQRALNIDMAKQPGLSLIAEQLGIPCSELDMHRALDDSIVTAACIRQLWDEEIFSQLCSKADSEFIRRLTFKTVILSNIDNPLINKNCFRQNCPACGARMRRTSDIVSKNKVFIASYHCSACDADYIGRHQFKLRFEGVSHKCTFKNAAEQPSAEAAPAETSAAPEEPAQPTPEAPAAE